MKHQPMATREFSWISKNEKEGGKPKLHLVGWRKPGSRMDWQQSGEFEYFMSGIKWHGGTFSLWGREVGFPLLSVLVYPKWTKGGSSGVVSGEVPSYVTIGRVRLSHVWNVVYIYHYRFDVLSVRKSYQVFSFNCWTEQIIYAKLLSHDICERQNW